MGGVYESTIYLAFTVINSQQFFSVGTHFLPLLSSLSFFLLIHVHICNLLAKKCTPQHTHTPAHMRTYTHASIHNGMTHFCGEINKPSLFYLSSRTNHVAAELRQLQGAQILFVAFSSCVPDIYSHYVHYRLKGQKLIL